MGKNREQRRRRVIFIQLRDFRKWIIAGCLLVLLAIILTYEVPSTRTWTYWTLPLSGKVIAIDAGHGGPDGGAVSKQGVIEKDINLAIALYLRDYLQQAGAVVYLTREGDYDLAKDGTTALKKRKTEDLHRRVELIEQKKVDLLISIHMNSFPSNRWSGAQTFFTSNHPDNKKLATLIQAEMKRNLENTDRVAKIVTTNVFLLKSLQIPTALVEVGFLSHPQESVLLADEQYQRKVSAAIYTGVLRYISGEQISK
ncbi:N-acetylmuramoyl-L-alanine amidase CwlD [Paenibacillus selenitireducens]|uniref:N-acetylmuramoyl-L-alanine amidase CwlD n=1 Tax=Paenibacillus selenitireducens TaxID=1324314 RepID=A0A1T2X0G5_9BACL|nr:N-acetylmuramoyl-L-alanine amidase CwlD [Paenibacillus selenitireducens]OPA73083.1 N-acetylmuramoyl-L-alanine amidase CwlD [Paenibacillus selenitireducens]